MGTPLVTPPGPLSPQANNALKGQVRQLADGSWATWNGIDWVPSQLPSGQLSPPMSIDGEGNLVLASGLIVAQGVTADSMTLTNDLTAANVTLSGNLRATGFVAANDYVIGAANYPSSGYSLGHGVIFDSTRTTSSSTGLTAETYVGLGVQWDHNIKRKMRVTCQTLIRVGDTGSQGAGMCTVLNLRGGVYAGNVLVTDPLLQSHHLDVGVGAQNSHRSSVIIHPADYPDGTRIYVGAWVTMRNPGTCTWQLIADPQYPTSFELEDVGS